MAAVFNYSDLQPQANAKIGDLKKKKKRKKKERGCVSVDACCMFSRTAEFCGRCCVFHPIKIYHQPIKRQSDGKTKRKTKERKMKMKMKRKMNKVEMKMKKNKKTNKNKKKKTKKK